MKKFAWRSFTGFAVVLLFAVATFAQTSAPRSAAGDKFLISARAGVVGYVEGGVTLAAANGRMNRVIKGDIIEVGERLSTTSDGRVEILLNPGSYVRLGSNSTFKFASTDLDDLRLSIVRGSAIFEVFAGDDFKVTVSTPATGFSLLRSGVYRIDVNGADASTLSVWKGGATAGSLSQQVKGGRSVTVSNGAVATAKFDRDQMDALDTWSKERAKESAKAVAQLEKRPMRTALMQSFLGRRWNIWDSFGLWVYSPFSGGFCFLPFGYGWSSPYGYGYGTWIGYYNLPPVIYTPPSGLPLNDPSQTIARQRRTNSGSDDNAAPPYIKLQTEGGAKQAADIFTDNRDTRSRDSGPAPVYFPPVVVPDPTSAKKP